MAARKKNHASVLDNDDEKLISTLSGQFIEQRHLIIKAKTLVKKLRGLFLSFDLNSYHSMLF